MRRHGSNLGELARDPKRDDRSGGAALPSGSRFPEAQRSRAHDRPAVDFTGKTVLVTGGSRGLGREMVLGFARRGADTVIVSRREESCRAWRRRSRRSAGGPGRCPQCLGLGRAGGPGGAHLAATGASTCLVNNAGSSPLAPLVAETPEGLFDKVLALNFKGPFRLTALLGSAMAAGRGGAVVNISSTGAIRPRPELAPYAGAKAALNAVTETFAREYAPKVRVNGIMPGRFLTDISHAWDEETRRNAEAALQRSGEPEEIVTAALYLSSDASGFTTGSVIRVDGGRALRAGRRVETNAA